MSQESTPDRKQCKYHYGDYTCPRSADNGSDYCIAHKEKKAVDETHLREADDESERMSVLNDSDIDRSCFNYAVTEVIQEGKKTGIFRFTGFRFPDGVKQFLPPRESLRGDFDFRGARFAGDALFQKVNITGNMYFFDAEFVGKADFSMAKIEGDVKFSRPSESVYCSHATLNSLILERAEVSGDINCKSIVLTGGCSFAGAQIAGNLILDEAKIGGNLWLQKGKSKGAEIGGDLRMERAVVKGSAILQRVQVAKKASFSNSRFEGRMWLADACFGDAVEFHGTALPRTGYFERIKVNPGKGRSLFNFAKRVKHEMGDSEDESDYHYLECWHAMRGLPRKRVRGVYAWLRYPRRRKRDIFCGHSVGKPVARVVAPAVGHMWSAVERFLAESVFGYGERPWQIAVISAGVIASCSLIYWLLETVGKRQGWISGTKAAYFSVVTFTTLGLGDLKPQGYLGRFVVGFEAIAGAFLMAAFLVSLARRWGRA